MTHTRESFRFRAFKISLFRESGKRFVRRWQDAYTTPLGAGGALCRALCRNPAIPTEVWLCRRVSLHDKQEAAHMPETRMNTASQCRSHFVSVAPSEFALRNGMEEVVGSIPTRSTKLLITVSSNKGEWPLSPFTANAGVVSVPRQKRVGFREGGEISLHDVLNELLDDIQGLVGHALVVDYLEGARDE